MHINYAHDNYWYSNKTHVNHRRQTHDSSLLPLHPPPQCTATPPCRPPPRVRYLLPVLLTYKITPCPHPNPCPKPPYFQRTRRPPMLPVRIIPYQTLSKTYLTKPQQSSCGTTPRPGPLDYQLLTFPPFTLVSLVQWWRHTTP